MQICMVCMKRLKTGEEYLWVWLHREMDWHHEDGRLNWRAVELKRKVGIHLECITWRRMMDYGEDSLWFPGQLRDLDYIKIEKYKERKKDKGKYDAYGIERKKKR